MGIAWHEHVLIAFALLLKFREEVAHRLSHLADFVAREKLEVNEHLVVARAARVQPRPGIPHMSPSLRVSMSSTCECTSSMPSSMTKSPDSAT